MKSIAEETKVTMSDDYPKVYLYRRIVQAKMFMDVHYADALDLHNIMQEARFSKFHFIRLFKSIYGLTPHQYLTNVRIENAKVFLRNGVSVTHTCFSVGFESVSSFTGLFKRVTQLTPSVYQRQAANRSEQVRRSPLTFVPSCFAEQHGWRPPFQ